MTGQRLCYLPRQESFEETTALGLALFLGAWSMTFAALLLTCGYLHGRGTAAPSIQQDGLLLPASVGIALLLGLSSLSLGWARQSLRRGHPGTLWVATLVASLFAWASGGAQLELLRRLASSGIAVRGSASASALFGLLGFHAFHVVVGAAGLGALSVSAFRHRQLAGRGQSLRLWSLYCHFVTAAWAFTVPLWVMA